jgi:EpsD family peptidyl-prolyl cis-trans isomerase
MGRLPSLALRGFRGAAVAALCVSTLAACGKKSGDQAAARGQIVAHVGDEVVTTQELENEFRWENIPASKQNDPESIRKVLNDLVLRKYLLRQAIDAKLDREPGVLLDMLRSREQVLATAFMTRAVAAKPPGKADIDDFIARNPLKFADRKLLSVEQVGFPLATTSLATVDAFRAANSLDDVQQQLTSAGVPNVRQMSLLNSGDLPQDFVAAMAAKNADGIFLVRSGANGLVFQIKGEQPRPLEHEAASELARQLLRAEALKAESGVAGLSARLDAKYEGEFAKIMGGANAAAETSN